MSWGSRGVLGMDIVGRKKKSGNEYVIHAIVCALSHYWWGSVDVWCGVGNYTALSLDHPISRSDNADYRLIKSCPATSWTNHPAVSCFSPSLPLTQFLIKLEVGRSSCRYPSLQWCPMQTKATEKVIKRPAAAEPKMQQQCSANLPTSNIFSAKLQLRQNKLTGSKSKVLPV